MHTTFLFENLQLMDHSENLGSGQAPVVDFCEHGNEHSRLIS
jgi:hypothetical protein